jgi:hypothetical protein
MTSLRDFVSPGPPRGVWMDGLQMYVKLGVITIEEAKAIVLATEEAEVRHILDKIETCNKEKPSP